MSNNHKHRLPAEWEPHETTWIAWPHNKNDWPGRFSGIKWIYAEIVKYISFGEKVFIIVQSKNHKLKAENVLKSVSADLSNIEFFIKKTNRGWLRDSAPFFVKDKKNITTVDFKFNAWAKYDNHKLDDKIPRFISNKLNLKNVTAQQNEKAVVLEGGAVDANGRGTLITSEECLLDQKVQVRNPGFTKQDYFEVFKNYLGITNVLWLGKGIAGDDTHGHVDDLCRFVNNDTVVLVQEEKSSDKNYHPLNENKERLQNIYLPNGSKLNVVELLMPSPVIFKGQRLPASYSNFYISNYAVLVPTFNDANDRIALGILSDLFPGRKVIGIHSVDLVWGLGTIHCLTKEQPK
ncbi:MAG: agmatine deiminase family protein [Ignavibacteria bacterium]|nr:agmatine deiminase family protein [Ignavibacteria bacterium]